MPCRPPAEKKMVTDAGERVVTAKLRMLPRIRGRKGNLKSISDIKGEECFPSELMDDILIRTIAVGLIGPFVQRGNAMVTQTWNPGTVGDWFTPANWASGTVPQTGDAVIIASGMPQIVSNTIVGEQITL